MTLTNPVNNWAVLLVKSFLKKTFNNKSRHYDSSFDANFYAPRLVLVTFDKKRFSLYLLLPFDDFILVPKKIAANIPGLILKGGNVDIHWVSSVDLLIIH